MTSVPHAGFQTGNDDVGRLKVDPPLTVSETIYGGLGIRIPNAIVNA